MALLAGACGGESVEDDLATAKDTSLTPAQRCRVVEDLAAEGDPAVATLDALAKDPSPKVARCARKALAHVDDPEAVGSLLSILRDSDPGVVASAAVALGWIGDPAAAVPLARLLVSQDPTLVITALRALGRIGDPRALPAIEKVALGPGGNKVRSAAVAALGNIGDPRAKETLVTVLGSDTANSMAAGVALVKLVRKDVTPLLPLLGESRNLSLAYALVDVGQGGTEDALVTALMTYGDVDLAEYYLNCGNRTLEKAAHTWASQHGYTVYTTPGSGGGQWGQGV